MLDITVAHYFNWLVCVCVFVCVCIRVLWLYFSSCGASSQRRAGVRNQKMPVNVYILVFVMVLPFFLLLLRSEGASLWWPSLSIVIMVRAAGTYKIHCRQKSIALSFRIRINAHTQSATHEANQTIFDDDKRNKINKFGLFGRVYANRC